MSTNASHVTDAALTLSDRERADLAFHLLKSLKPPVVPNADDPTFADELERRVANYEAGGTSASDWDEVSTRVLESLHERRSS